MADVKEIPPRMVLPAELQHLRVAAYCQLAIDGPDANIVRTIFEMRAGGKSLGAISDWLYENKIPSPTGKERWSRDDQQAAEERKVCGRCDSRIPVNWTSISFRRVIRRL